jgi:ribosomal protein S6
VEYELLFFTSVANEEKINLIKKDITGILESLGAKLSTDFFDIGKRKLAYPIKRNTHAFFSFVRFWLDDENKQNISEIGKRLALYNNIIRHIIVRADEIGKPIISEEIRFKQKEKTIKLTEKAKSDEEKPKASLSELDEKLNEILEETPE